MGRTHRLTPVVMTDKTVIPPVTTGTINSSIDFEYAGRRDRGIFEATSELQWQFDGGAYARQSDYDLGANYPWVPQENGHTLRRIIEMRVQENSDGGYYLWYAETAVRGLTSTDKTFWTIEGSYTLTENNTVCDRMSDRQPHRYRDTDTPHYELPQMTGTYDEMEQAVLHIHNEQHRDGIKAILQEIINRDCPADAVPINDSHVAPNHTTMNQQPVSGD